MEEKKKGISLLALSITIVIMIILASTIVISYSSILQDTLKKDFASEIYSIEKLAQEYYFMNQEYPVSDPYILSLSSIQEEFRDQFEKEKIEGDRITLYQIDFVQCGVENIKRGHRASEKDIYVISKITGKVYYINGITIEQIRYYTLTEELKNSIGL